jgi:hypothetical protein
MQNPSAKKPPQPALQPKQIPTQAGWNVPTLADLLQRLSVNSTSPSKRLS